LKTFLFLKYGAAVDKRMPFWLEQLQNSKRQGERALRHLPFKTEAAQK
jgi:hypothetical protein